MTASTPRRAVRDHLRIPDVAADQLGLVRKILGPPAFAMDLLDQAVEHPDLPAPLQQSPTNRPSDKARTARHQNLFVHHPILVLFSS
jgi:hypothetical protein